MPYCHALFTADSARTYRPATLCHVMSAQPTPRQPLGADGKMIVTLRITTGDDKHLMITGRLKQRKHDEGRRA